MLGGVFELAARAGIVLLVSGRSRCLPVSDPAAWIAALIPLVPFYFLCDEEKKFKRVLKRTSGSAGKLFQRFYRIA